MYKVVIDANVWIRFARAKNITPLLDRFVHYNFIPVVNNYLLSEVFDVVVDQQWMNINQAQKLIDFIASISLVKAERAVFALSPDPKDNYLFDLSVQNNCTFLITDDIVLLALEIKPVHIHTTKWFLKHFPL